MQNINTDYNWFKVRVKEKKKSIFKVAETPATLVAIIMLFYIKSNILNLAGLFLFEKVANILTFVATFLLASWTWIQYV